MGSTDRFQEGGRGLGTAWREQRHLFATILMRSLPMSPEWLPLGCRKFFNPDPNTNRVTVPSPFCAITAQMCSALLPRSPPVIEPAGKALCSWTQARRCRWMCSCLCRGRNCRLSLRRATSSGGSESGPGNRFPDFSFHLGLLFKPHFLTLERDRRAGTG